MHKSTKRALSFTALIGAAVIFGMVVAGSVNVTPRTEAQRVEPAARTSRQTSSVVLPSFADIADEAMPAVVSITSTNITKGSANRRQMSNPFGGGGGDGQGQDPFEFVIGPSRKQARADSQEEH